ncbi:MAG: hypothetical protein U1C57_01710 [Candidatus Doudnabacteria bacterium]|nr:hypothetical protein [bacterium]MDZ4243800.1 hypothetical protein [Candidatus Doudnabacteria bacterium]
MERGKFIVFYGVNNLGKTTQAKLLTEKLQTKGCTTKNIKYPIYDLSPSGPMINSYMREENPLQLSAREAQIMYALNRYQYEPQLKSLLEKGISIVAEDYWGTGVAWGIGAGVDEGFLLKLNGDFHPPDLAILFMGKRFGSGIEKFHLHEKNEKLSEGVAKVHDELGERFGWERVNANQPIEKVAEDIWQITKSKLKV